MNTATILMTWGDSAANDRTKWNLEGVLFEYCGGSTWQIFIDKRCYEVSELVASQVAYSLTVCADKDTIKESLEDDEVYYEPEDSRPPHEILGISFDEWEEQENRKSHVRTLFEKARVNGS